MGDELVNAGLLFELDQARQIIGAWVAGYTAMPHSSLGYKAPAANIDHLP